VHTSAAELNQRLPRAEHQHWAQHVVTPQVSSTFVTMRLAPGSCIDDGDLRDFSSDEGTQDIGRSKDTYG
jgi:hypothetical protein